MRRMKTVAAGVVALCVAISAFGVAGAAPEAVSAVVRTTVVGVPASDAEKLLATLSPAAPAEADEATVAAQAKVRGSLGLRSDTKWISQVLGDPASVGAVTASGGDFYGLTLASDEVSVVAQRNFLQNTMSSATGVNAAAMAAWQSFVETRLAIVDGKPRATMFFDEVPGEIEDWLDKALPTEARSLVSAEPIPAPRADLDALEAEMTQVTRSEQLQVSFAIHYEDGRVWAGSPDQASLDRLAKEFVGRPIDLELTGDGGPTGYDKNQVLPYGLMESGMKLVTAQSADQCTSGFSVNSGYGPMLLTAGHCFQLNWDVTAPGPGSWNAVGRVAARSYPNEAGSNWNFDAETVFAPTRPLWGRQHVNRDDWGHRINGWIGQNTDSLGDFYCHSGISSSGMDGYGGPRCGALLEKTFQPWWMNFANPVFRRIDTDSVPGDSGGGVWWGTIYGDLAVALVQGRMTSRDGTNVDAILSHLPYITNAWGLTVMTN
jgi:hypothetical protein